MMLNGWVVGWLGISNIIGLNYLISQKRDHNTVVPLGWVVGWFVTDY